ncbi:UvrD-helicase domain-containing protein [Gracilimonas mengyeensis]|uniref:DNA 3'-5' helicase n=1 Tax=Gracilimonas mengyeensis TaxID=1302730 RepID=A0A521FCY0_9BACT|nr:UvrD-helicase domain-containing protein [Gracilimonas mengyeensis]SMO94047.1 Superfamily I DNA or RNA helicase [Gracilimonas mengyeensis]
MNGKVSDLDRFVLISNSDAHSPSKLGREANLLNTELSYDAMFEAFRTGEGLTSTYEFYPEEGKYHHDGHRKCGISLEPKETRKYNNICPECGKPLTVGVLSRVEELADREETAKKSGFEYIIPLPEVLGEIEGVGPKTKTVRGEFQKVISTFGNEFDLMREIPVEEIEGKGGPVLAEAIRHIRENEVFRNPGYDGVFGEIKVFKDGEIDRIRGQMGFFGLDEYVVEKETKVAKPEPSHQLEKEATSPQSTGLNEEQQKVCEAQEGATLVKAGPGTGKTHTLVEWLTGQAESGRKEPDEILAVTFTNKAAAELQERLSKRIGRQARRITAGTFHALCWKWLREVSPELQTIYDASARKMSLRMLFPEMDHAELRDLNEQLVQYLELDTPVDRETKQKICRYRDYCEEQGAVDLSGVIRSMVELLEDEPGWLQKFRSWYKVFAVDEFQDINPMQYKLVQLLAGGQDVLAIGDPDQAIYGFRGSDVRQFFQFTKDFEAREIALKRNYRSTGKVLEAAGALIRKNILTSGISLVPNKPEGIRIQVFEAENPFKEADYILDQIAKYVGGIESMSSGKYTDSGYDFGLSDIAILFRTHTIGDALFKALVKAGIPVHYGDGSSFFAEAPFTKVSNLLKLVLKPANHLLLSTVMEENYEWSRSEVESLVTALNDQKATLFGNDALASISIKRKGELEDLRSICQLVKKKLEENQLAAAVEVICRHFLPDEELSESDQLKKETLLDLAEETEGDAEDFLQQMQLNPYTDAGRLKSEAVQLLTFHAAKGLEFPIVFIAGAEEGITPLDRDSIDLEEERRLFYVAMTRAEEELQITGSKERVRFGELLTQEASRFIAELPDMLMDRVRSGAKKSYNQSENEQLGLF